MFSRIQSFFRWFFNSRLKRWIFLYTPVLLLLFVIFSNVAIIQAGKGKLFDRVEDVPAKSIALVFGTSPKARSGRDNLFYTYRIQATAALWASGKIKHIIVSGDNSRKDYDESSAMKADLVALGVPDSVITIDYAGFRTLDSVVRCKWVFGQSDIVVVSQQFQNERALFIAEHFGINAVALNAKDVPGNYSYFTKVREYFARAKAVLDIFILRTEPKFPGPPEPIKD